jgi:hypothetical protein
MYIQRTTVVSDNMGKSEFIECHKTSYCFKNKIILFPTSFIEIDVHSLAL